MGEEPKIISALAIPVQVFVLFMVQNKRDFTVQDAINDFEKMHHMVLPEAKMRKILNDLVLCNNLNLEKRPNGMKNKETSFYTFKKLI